MTISGRTIESFCSPYPGTRQCCRPRSFPRSSSPARPSTGRARRTRPCRRPQSRSDRHRYPVRWFSDFGPLFCGWSGVRKHSCVCEAPRRGLPKYNFQGDRSCLSSQRSALSAQHHARYYSALENRRLCEFDDSSYRSSNNGAGGGSQWCANSTWLRHRGTRKSGKGQADKVSDREANGHSQQSTRDCQDETTCGIEGT